MSYVCCTMMCENNEINCVSLVALCLASSERFGAQCNTSGRVHKLLVRRISRVVLRSGLRRCVQSQVWSPGDSPGHAHNSIVWRLSRARSRQWLVTLRPVRGAKPQVIHLDVPMIVFGEDCLVRVVGNGLRRCVQSQGRSAR